MLLASGLNREVGTYVRTAVLAGELAGMVTVTALPMTKTRQITQNTAAEWL